MQSLQQSNSVEGEAMDATNPAKKPPKKKRRHGRSPHPPQKGSCFGGAAALAKKYPFPTDFCDHFESPKRAYEDVAPVLAALTVKPRAEMRLYDPYYCAGAAKRHLQALGFSSVKNDKLDFYASDAYQNPSRCTHDILVTNPPFSDDHKERCLRWALATKKPFALLLPAYVVDRRWFREACGDARPFFVAPAESYGFDHPLGVGAAASPFFSVWVVGTGTGAAATAAVRASLGGTNILVDVDALRRAGHVRTEAKRPSSKKRRKLKARRAGGVG